MKIEVGKTYITAGGEKAGPMVNQHNERLFVEEKENLISPYFNVRQSWNRDGTVCHAKAEDIPHTLVAEYVEPVAKLKITDGGTYVTRDGRKVNLAEYEGRSFKFAGKVELDENQVNRVFQSDGTHGSYLVQNVPGLDIVAEYDPAADKRGVTPRADAVLSGLDEVARLNAVIEGLTGKLQRVQNIHAHTIKTVRKARAQVKKVNAALSEEQRKNGALRTRLAEVARAVGEASEYVAKVSKPVVDVDVSNVFIMDLEDIKNVIKEGPGFLGGAFQWKSTPQCHKYWEARFLREEKLTSADYKFLKALLDR